MDTTELDLATDVNQRRGYTALQSHFEDSVYSLALALESDQYLACLICGFVGDTRDRDHETMRGGVQDTIDATLQGREQFIRVFPRERSTR